MPSSFLPALPTGSSSTSDHPRIAVGDAVLRPWLLDDAAALVEAFDDPAIRQWHVSRADTEESARTDHALAGRLDRRVRIQLGDRRGG